MLRELQHFYRHSGSHQNACEWTHIFLQINHGRSDSSEHLYMLSVESVISAQCSKKHKLVPPLPPQKKIKNHRQAIKNMKLEIIHAEFCLLFRTLYSGLVSLLNWEHGENCWNWTKILLWTIPDSDILSIFPNSLLVYGLLFLQHLISLWFSVRKYMASQARGLLS